MSKRCILIDETQPIKHVHKNKNKNKKHKHVTNEPNTKKQKLGSEYDNRVISFINSITIKQEPKNDAPNTLPVDDFFIESSDTSIISYEPMTIENIVHIPETVPMTTMISSPSEMVHIVDKEKNKNFINKKIDIVDTKNTKKIQKTRKLDTTRTRLASTVLTGEEKDIPIESVTQSSTTKQYTSHSRIVSDAIEKKSIIDNIDNLCEQVFGINSEITSLDRFIHNNSGSLPSMTPGHPIVHTLIKFTKEINENSKKFDHNNNYVIPVVSRTWVESMLYEPPRDNIWPTCSSGVNCIGLNIFPGHKVLLRSFFASCEKKSDINNFQEIIQKESEMLNRPLTEDERNNIIRLHARKSLVPIININSQKPTPGPCFLCLCTFVINTSIRYILASSKCPSNTLWNPVRVLTGINGEFPTHTCFYDNGKNNMICDAIYCPSVHTLQPIISEDGLKGFKFLFTDNIDYHFLA